MKCPKCNINTVFNTPFLRMNEIGKMGVFWCEPCAKKYEPELYKNLKDDESQVEKDLKQMAYGDK